MSKKRGAKPITVYCSICNRPHPNKVRPSKLKRFTHLICPDCDIADIPKESYEVRYVTLAAIGGWHGVRVAIPDQEALEGIERAERIKEAMIAKLHLNDLN